METRLENALRLAHEQGRIKLAGSSPEIVEATIRVLMRVDFQGMETLTDLKQELARKNWGLKDPRYDFRDTFAQIGKLFELF